MSRSSQRRTSHKLKLSVSLLLIFVELGARASASTALPADAIAAEFEKQIPALMQAQIIPGLAVVIVDKQGILWRRGYGISNYQERQPVTPDTLFSIQSMSKTVTATAVMLAAQQGLVDLDTPITEYLPDFRVNSIFEAQPERKITLRHLLSHTAGFTHEAPVGNNFNLDTGTFKEHILSISRTWLRFPVGENYAYSNLGVDLAGYIIQVKSGMPFEQYVQAKLFEPLGMLQSTLDPDRISNERNLATGHEMTYSQVPLRVPMLAAGGVYTSAQELAQFVRFFLNRGRLGDRQILGEAYIDAMCEVPSLAHGRTGGYGLGLARLNRPGPIVYGHSGGGFGFKSDMYWYPELGIGGALLTNSPEHGLQQDLIFKILDRFVSAMGLIPQKQTSPVPSAEKQNTSAWPDPRKDLIENNPIRLSRFQQKVTEERKAAWATYAGDYDYRLWGKPVGVVRVRSQNDILTMNSQPLYETEAGLFFGADGEVLDFRSGQPIWRSIELHRINSPLWQKVLMGLSVLLFPLGLFVWAAVAGYCRIRGQVKPRPQSEWSARMALLIAVVNTALCLLFLAIVFLFPFLLNGGWPELTPIMPGSMKAALLIPAGIALLTAIMVATSIVILRSRLWPKSFQRPYVLLSFGAVLFVVLMISWQVLKFV